MSDFKFLSVPWDIEQQAKTNKALESALIEIERAFAVCFEKLMTDVILTELTVHNEKIRDLLGQWVSELEPEVFYGPGPTLLGIGAEGSGVISLKVMP